MNAPRPVLTVYLRRYCHLCHDLLAQLVPHQARHGFQIVEVDIDPDPQLEARYGALVPVLTGADGREICHYFLDEAALTAYLSEFR